MIPLEHLNGTAMTNTSIAKKRESNQQSFTTALRVMIVDDHPVVRAGFAQYIEAATGIAVCFQTGSAPEAFAKYCELRPDIALIDLSLKEGSGMELIKDILAYHGEARMIVISGHDEDLYAERCIRAGAMGYISKHEAAEKIIDAIEAVRQGDVYLNPALSSRLLRRAAGKSPENIADPKALLSDRELEVFELLGQGHSIKQIAEHLYLSPKTIETYRSHLKDKLQVTSSQQLARLAYQWVESTE